MSALDPWNTELVICMRTTTLWGQQPKATRQKPPALLTSVASKQTKQLKTWVVWGTFSCLSRGIPGALAKILATPVQLLSPLHQTRTKLTAAKATRQVSGCSCWHHLLQARGIWAFPRWRALACLVEEGWDVWRGLSVRNDDWERDAVWVWGGKSF
jgi:hypothetical protein